MNEKYMLVIAAFALVFSQVFSQNSENKKINFGSIDIAPDKSAFIFTKMIVNKDFSDYSPGKWKLYHYNLTTKILREIDSGIVYAEYSPEGDFIAFGKVKDDNWDIYTFDLASGVQTRLTNDPVKESAPSWSPDGKRIAFMKKIDDSYDVYVLSLETQSTFRVTNNEYSCYNPVWSPVTNEIVYYLEKGDKMDQVYLTNAKGSFNINITSDNNHNVFPKWLDENTIYYFNKGSVIKIKKDGTNKEIIDNLGGDCVCFTHDKKQILIADNKTGTISIAEYFNSKMGQKETILNLGVNNKK